MINPTLQHADVSGNHPPAAATAAPLPPVVMRTGGGPATFLAKVWAVATKDLRAELQGREVFSLSLIHI